VSERLIVSVDAESIRVEDAFSHILDLFALVASQSEAGASEGDVFWRLVSVTKQSPFTVIAEAVSDKSDVDVDGIARAQKARFSKNYAELRKGRLPAAWSGGRARAAAQGVMRRSRKGINSTRLVLDEKAREEVVITDADATIAEPVFQPIPLSRPREQIGSIEGVFIQVGTHYNQPAILVRERKTGRDIWCVVTEEQARELIAEHANFRDVWSGRRIVVRGLVSYEGPGLISRVIASDVRRVEGRDVEVSQIRDTEVTGGLSVEEYLSKFREGDLG
jgi:hypothetical protein